MSAGLVHAGAPRCFPTGSTLFRAAPSPPAGPLIKDDPDTVIWAQEIGGRRAIVKMYRHRGAGVLLRERLVRFRVQREFDALARMFACGVPCCEPLAWGYGHSHEHGGYEFLATAEIAAARSVTELLCARDEQAQRWDYGPLFRIVRRMHESGVFHGALKLHNVLVVRGRGREPSFHVIDTPRALLYPRSLVGTRMATFDLLRLSTDLARMLGASVADVPFAEYGLDERARLELLARMRAFRATKAARARIRARALLSQAGAHLAARSGLVSATVHA